MHPGQWCQIRTCTNYSL